MRVTASRYTKGIETGMKRAKNIFWTVIMVLIMMISSVSAGQIKSMRIGQGIGSVRIVFDADSEFEYKAFLLSAPSRLVVDVYDVNVNQNIERQISKNNLISSTRLGVLGENGKRIVFDLEKPVVIKKAFMLAPQSNFGWR